MTTENALSTSWSDDEVAVMHRLRDWTMASEELNRHLSTWLGLSVTDAEALGHVVWAAQAGRPVSPIDLARQLGMTSGAVSVLVDRLERAGFVSRHRDDDDRRRVSVHPSSSALEGVSGFLDLAGAEIAAAVRDTPAEEIRVVRAFLERMTSASADANARLRSRTTSAPTSASRTAPQPGIDSGSRASAPGPPTRVSPTRRTHPAPPPPNR